jgi:hypothetical protein
LLKTGAVGASLRRFIGALGRLLDRFGHLRIVPDLGEWPGARRRKAV